MPYDQILSSDQPQAASSKPAAPRRRWFSFSLRTILILVTTIAVFFGVWIDRSKHQAQTVAKLRELLNFSDSPNGPMTGSGFRYSCDSSFEQNPRNLFAKSWVLSSILDKIGIDYFHVVDGVSLDRASKPKAAIKTQNNSIFFHDGELEQDIEKEDRVLEVLRGLPYLKYFTSNYLTGNLKDGKNNLFEVLGAMSGLEELNLLVSPGRNFYSIQKKDILNLCKLHRLKKFTLISVQIDSDADLIQFSELIHLTYATIHLSRKTTLNGFQSLKKLENLNDLTITFENEITKEHIDLLANSFPKLNRLMLNSLPDSEILVPLLKHPSLTTLHFTDSNVAGVCVVTMPAKTPPPAVSPPVSNAKP